MVENVLEKLTALFSEGGANFRVVEHVAGGKSSESVAAQRGTVLGQGAKALCCVVKGSGRKQYVLAVLPADMKADLSRVAEALGGKRASLASPGEVLELTGSVFGAVPPVSFHPDLALIADPALFTRFDELAFNAGHLDRSIIINTQDFKRIVDPRLVEFALVTKELA